LFFSGVKLDAVKKLKGGHFRLSLTAENTRIDGLLFSPSDMQIDAVQSNSVIDILAEPQWNYYQNQKSVQLLIKEVRKPMFQQLQVTEVEEKESSDEKEQLKEI
jgi:hypothetical protein